MIEEHAAREERLGGEAFEERLRAALDAKSGAPSTEEQLRKALVRRVYSFQDIVWCRSKALCLGNTDPFRCQNATLQASGTSPRTWRLLLSPFSQFPKRRISAG